MAGRFLVWLRGMELRLVRTRRTPIVKPDRFVSPTEGQRFTPGDTVDLVVRATVPLAAIYAGVGPRGVGVGLPDAGVLVLAPDADGVTYRAKFVIPRDFKEPLSLAAMAETVEP
jgi:hypothetical protein